MPKFSLSSAMAKSSNFDSQTKKSSADQTRGSNAPYATNSGDPTKFISMFLSNARQQIKSLPPATQPTCEIECRLGILQQPQGHPRRLLSNVAVNIDKSSYQMNQLVNGNFVTNPNLPNSNFVAGVTRSHYSSVSGAGVSDFSALSSSFGIKRSKKGVRGQLLEDAYEETVYYSDKGQEPQYQGARYVTRAGAPNTLELKTRRYGFDIAVPASCYDLRLSMSSEEQAQGPCPPTPPKKVLKRRLKKRRSYDRADGRFAWRIDVTEVFTLDDGGAMGGTDETTHEVEVEMLPEWTAQLLEKEGEELEELIKLLSKQLYWCIQNLAPTESDLEVGDFLDKEERDKGLVSLARRQCQAVESFGNSRDPHSTFTPYTSASDNMKNFIGCMPVSFQRHNFDTVCTGDYYVSEKTDGVRYLLAFVEDQGGAKKAVLLDRKMDGWRPKEGAEGGEPALAKLAQHIAPGTVLDGEVVINRRQKRPIFIIFDVLCSGNNCLAKLPFQERLRHLQDASFVTPQGGTTKFQVIDGKLGSKDNACVPMPLIRKMFQRGKDVDELLNNIVEDKGLRMFCSGENHQHLTDGIIFQPNLKYIFGRDDNLLKWKYLDTATIDVRVDKEPKGYKFTVDAGDGHQVDMSQYIKLPAQEIMRMEADRNCAKNCHVAEVGFNPATGEWYYKMMRTDKSKSNFIATVMGTLLEVAEGITTNEIRIRMMGNEAAKEYDANIKKLEGELLRAARRVGGGEGGATTTTTSSNKKRKLS
ncbi:hypothetical protein TrLO_g5424 [Triparma laevis f. longispina]|uniref:mRNA 5'-phosphatase n=1 Tax=Triparma laevis f. longispina TaxID=1714387 RepID=A0A9W6ZT61_9STRA|nr:hypothetical protein TrLO_g5424 [Triparma laevis f. longispina]